MNSTNDDAKLLSICQRLAYVIVREEITEPIINSQVIDVLKGISRRSGTTILLLWFFRVDRLMSNKVSITTVKKELARQGIRLLPIPFIGWRFPASWWLLPLLLPQWLFGFLWVYCIHGVRVFHCRSYHSALAATIFGKIFPSRFIFDPRSPMPEENLIAGRWKRGQWNFPFWKKIEAWICRSADIIIGVSAPFVKSLQRKAETAQFVTIPNNYPASFSSKGNHNTDAVKREAPDRRLLIGYVGTFGHWNNASLYIDLLQQFFEHAPSSAGVRFIVPNTSRSALERALQHATFDHHRVEVESLPQNEVFDRLADCTLGLQLMSHPDDRLSIKFVEYIAAGVPVAVSTNVRGAADMVHRTGVGIVLEGGEKDTHALINFASSVLEDRETWRQKCQTLAMAEFSTDAVVEKLVKLYTSLETEKP